MQKFDRSFYWGPWLVKEFCITGHRERNDTQTTRFAKYQRKEAFASNRSKGSHECEACDKKHLANFCCLDCKENMCKTAAQSHTRNKASRDHRVVSLEELEANPQLASVSLICQTLNDKFRFFDERCGYVVCRECIAVEHFGHVCLPLAEAAFKYQLEVEDLIEETNILLGEAKVMEAEADGDVFGPEKSS